MKRARTLLSLPSSSSLGKAFAGLSLGTAFLAACGVQYLQATFLRHDTSISKDAVGGPNPPSPFPAGAGGTSFDQCRCDRT